MLILEMETLLYLFVFIGLGGNFTQQQLKKELDHFLSEMDARTAFFRG